MRGNDVRVKGTAFIARRKMVVEQFGQKAWDEILAKVATEVPEFRKEIFASGSVPIEAFMKLQEALLQQFYKNNIKAYWEMGVRSAQWSLTEGPYKKFLDSKDIPSLVKLFPAMWTNYYDEGNLVGSVENKVVHAKIQNLKIWHISLENMVMGYLQRALELVCGRSIVAEKVIGGYSSPEIYYKFHT